MADMEITIDGLDDLLKKLDGNRLVGPVVRHMLGEAVAIGKKTAVESAPSWTGHLRQNIVPDISGESIPSWATLIAKPEYSSWLEDGTRPHWPPPGALTAWADSHNMPEYMVRRAIGLRGTKAHPFMKPATDDINEALPGLINKAESELQQIWESK